jgi:hypothetical protein
MTRCKLGVEEAEARGIFRVDDGKANLAPPAEKAVYRRMIGVQLPNEEWVGVAVDFKLPDPFENITKKMTLDIQNIVAKAEADGEPFRASVQAKQWVGHAIAPVLKLGHRQQGAQGKAVGHHQDMDRQRCVAGRNDHQQARRTGCAMRDCGRMDHLVSR